MGSGTLHKTVSKVCLQMTKFRLNSAFLYILSLCNILSLYHMENTVNEDLTNHITGTSVSKWSSVTPFLICDSWVNRHCSRLRFYILMNHDLTWLQSLSSAEPHSSQSSMLWYTASIQSQGFSQRDTLHWNKTQTMLFYRMITRREKVEDQHKAKAGFSQPPL